MQFRIGIIGMILFMIGALVSAISLIATGLGYSVWVPDPIGVVGVLLLGLGGTMTAFTFLGYYKKYKFTLGLATFVISLVFSWWGFGAYLMQYMGDAVWVGPYSDPSFTYPPYNLPYYWEEGDLNGLFYILAFVAIVLLGIMVLEWGISMLLIANRSANPGLTMTAGILYFIAGLFAISLVLFIVAFILAVPAGILGLIAVKYERQKAA